MTESSYKKLKIEGPKITLSTLKLIWTLEEKMTSYEQKNYGPSIGYTEFSVDVRIVTSKELEHFFVDSLDTIHQMKDICFTKTVNELGCFESLDIQHRMQSRVKKSFLPITNHIYIKSEDIFMQAILSCLSVNFCSGDYNVPVKLFILLHHAFYILHIVRSRYSRKNPDFTPRVNGLNPNRKSMEGYLQRLFRIELDDNGYQANYNLPNEGKPPGVAMFNFENVNDGRFMNLFLHEDAGRTFLDRNSISYDALADLLIERFNFQKHMSKCLNRREAILYGAFDKYLEKNSVLPYFEKHKSPLLTFEDYWTKLNITDLTFFVEFHNFH